MARRSLLPRTCRDHLASGPPQPVSSSAQPAVRSPFSRRVRLACGQEPLVGLLSGAPDLVERQLHGSTRSSGGGGSAPRSSLWARLRPQIRQQQQPGCALGWSVGCARGAPLGRPGPGEDCCSLRMRSVSSSRPAAGMGRRLAAPRVALFNGLGKAGRLRILVCCWQRSELGVLLSRQPPGWNGFRLA